MLYQGLLDQDKQLQQNKAATPQPKHQTTIGPAAGNGQEIILQIFNWESSKLGGQYYNKVKKLAKDCYEAGVTSIWLPPCSNSVSQEGYLPRDLYELSSSYGTAEDLAECIKQYKQYNIKVNADIVINHRCASKQKDGVWNQYGGRLDWDETAICSNNPVWRGKGSRKSGDDYPAAPNLDHSNHKVQQDLIEWMKYLMQIGFDGFRFDYVKGYGGRYVGKYINAIAPEIAFGEFWDSCDYHDGALSYNQDAHRQRIINWINATGNTAAAFDFTTKGILQEAIYREEYWRLVDSKGKSPGVMGWWPSRAITFIENHDTGGTLNHWPFPYHGLQQGYAYILTHPGTPCIFNDHFFSSDHDLRNCIKQLLKVRKEQGIHNRSQVQIKQAQKQVYSCLIDNKTCMKIGPGDWCPAHDNIDVGQKEWKLACSGQQFAVWVSQF